MSHESSLLKELSKLRTEGQLAVKERVNNLDDITPKIENGQRMLSKFIVIIENYPDFKATKLNVKLMNKLVDLENEVSLMREGYNDAATYYNIRIKSVPDIFFARLLNFKKLDLLSYKDKNFARLVVGFE